MNSAASDPALIGLDWGTTSFRAALIGADGSVLETLHAPEGIMHVEGGCFEAAFERLLSPWACHRSLPVLASGMITSRNGWVETPYVSLPAGIEELANALVAHTTDTGRQIQFVTGLASEINGAPDVMRGEETQIVGAIASGAVAGCFVMPGTHSKWVEVDGGRIENFATYMTGDIFAALRDHTILKALMAEMSFQKDGFSLGVSSGLSAGCNLLHRLFHVRSLPLFNKIPAEMSADYLSGLLIGAEIAGGQTSMTGEGPVTIVGRSDLADRYEIALDIAGRESRRAENDIVARGHFVIARTAGLIT
ncbi:2-dehydro-3-deoxygalactonokinase [Amaricoccus macauensis]|uniref:2-dehydro-3-deoxygalactonokinase n=1 Tax=Amaricoccus macauensis TaxID=57001 RepID=UPI003C7BEBB2